MVARAGDIAWAEVATAKANAPAINLIIVTSRMTFQERLLGGGACAVSPIAFSIYSFPHGGSSTEAKPRITVWGKLVDISLSPTLAGRDASIAWSFNISLRSVFARNVREGS
ncbi:MAG: hypothetical protein WBQ20_05495, partial [Methyloceanibacter sp.]